MLLQCRQGMSYKCLFDCRHPLWGGTGICIEDDLTIVGRCSCDTGYSTRDAAGYPSCVPKRVLVVLYLVLGLSGLLSAALNLWHASLYRHLSMQFQAARRATIRMRVLMAGRCGNIGLRRSSTAVAVLHFGIMTLLYPSLYEIK